MTTHKLLAKPIVENQFWVITDGDTKIGNIQATGTEILVRLQDHIEIYPDLDSVRAQIDFAPDKPKEVAKAKKDAYNVMVDVARKLTIFTTTPDSKCFYVEGWFVIDKDGVKEVTPNPKYIFVTRYPAQGPFTSKQEATEVLNSIAQ